MSRTAELTECRSCKAMVTQPQKEEWLEKTWEQIGIRFPHLCVKCETDSRKRYYADVFVPRHRRYGKFVPRKEAKEDWMLNMVSRLNDWVTIHKRHYATMKGDW